MKRLIITMNSSSILGTGLVKLWTNCFWCKCCASQDPLYLKLISDKVGIDKIIPVLLLVHRFLNLFNLLWIGNIVCKINCCDTVENSNRYYYLFLRNNSNDGSSFKTWFNNHRLRCLIENTTTAYSEKKNTIFPSI